MTRLFATVLLVAFIFSCNSKKSLPSGILKPDKMKLVFWDILKADALTATLQKNDAAKNFIDTNIIYQKKIFALHKTSREEFYNSLSYYKKNTVLMQLLMDSMMAMATKERYMPAVPVMNPLKAQ